MALNLLDEKWMRRCIQLAKNGCQSASPNPMVGAVIVHENKIIGEGWHRECGTPHAEVNAVRSVPDSLHRLIPESTIYVSLEPCAHFGRTPPCAEMIVRQGFHRCVVGCIDPFAKVSGRGIEILRRGGVEVTVGVLEKECLELNRKFVTSQTLRRPFVTLKWSRSSDGFIDRWRIDELTGAQNPEISAALISTPHTLMRVHRLRAEHDAILVGHATLLADRPTLTVRHWSGPNPRRFVLGRIAEGDLPAGFTAFADIPTLLAAAHAEGIRSLLVEGGAQTLQSFIDAGLWDEAYEELGREPLGSGVPVPRMPVGVPTDCDTLFGIHIRHYCNLSEFGD